MLNRDWFQVPVPRPHAELRLVCLPYAGGSTTTYLPWTKLLPSSIELALVTLPGRAARYNQPAIRRLDALVELLVGVLPDDRPLALFGHSFGALVAWDLALELRERGRPLPRHLFVSGRSAPATPPARATTGAASREELLQTMRDEYGTDPRVLASRELMEMVLTTLRADLDASTSWRRREVPPLEVPATVLYGHEDPIAGRDQVAAWAQEFTRRPELVAVPGGHLFVDKQAARVCAIVEGCLG